jgi:hypothetical protein
MQFSAPDRDMRQGALLREVLSSVSKLAFSPDGRRLLTRDFMTLKVWDLAMPATPLLTLPVHEQLRPRLEELYGNGMLFDKHECAWSAQGRCALLGCKAAGLQRCCAATLLSCCCWAASPPCMRARGCVSLPASVCLCLPLPVSARLRLAMPVDACDYLCLPLPACARTRLCLSVPVPLPGCADLCLPVPVPICAWLCLAVHAERRASAPAIRRLAAACCTAPRPDRQLLTAP